MSAVDPNPRGLGRHYQLMTTRLAILQHSFVAANLACPLGPPALSGRLGATKCHGMRSPADRMFDRAATRIGFGLTSPNHGSRPRMRGAGGEP